MLISWDINSRNTFLGILILGGSQFIFFITNQQEKIGDNEELMNNEKTVSFYHKNQLLVRKILDIKKLTAEGNYTQLVDVDNHRYLIRRTLKSWDTELPKSCFVKVSRSCIINKNFIEKIFIASNYQLQIQLKGTQELVDVSKRKSPALKKELSSFVHP